MTLQEVCKKGEETLSAAGIRDAKSDAWLLFSHVTGLSRNDFFLRWDGKMDEKAIERFFSLVDRRLTRVPVQHLTGEAWFYGHCFLVNGDVLIPRPDTEVLVEQALARLHPGDRVLDLCTGSGCVLSSLLLAASGADSGASAAEAACEGDRADVRSSDAGMQISGTGADISFTALEIAKQNATQLGVEAKWVESNLFTAIHGRYHMITANPPYIATATIDTLEPEVRNFDPRLALDGGPDGLRVIRAICEQAGEYLEPGGHLLLEIGYDQGGATRQILIENRFSDVQIAKDLAGHDRVVIGSRPDTA